jgi:hypothetical protein
MQDPVRTNRAVAAIGAGGTAKARASWGTLAITCPSGAASGLLACRHAARSAVHAAAPADLATGRATSRNQGTRFVAAAHSSSQGLQPRRQHSSLQPATPSHYCLPSSIHSGFAAPVRSWSPPAQPRLRYRLDSSVASRCRLRPGRMCHPWCPDPRPLPPVQEQTGWPMPRPCNALGFSLNALRSDILSTSSRSNLTPTPCWRAWIRCQVPEHSNVTITAGIVAISASGARPGARRLEHFRAAKKIGFDRRRLASS